MRKKMRGILKSKTGQKPGFRPVLFKPKLTLLAQPAILQHRLNLRSAPAPFGTVQLNPCCSARQNRLTEFLPILAG